MMRLALTMLNREFRGGELGLLIAAMIIAVGTVTTIGFFVDRLQRALALESAAFIAADRVLASSEPIPPDFEASARSLGLNTTSTVEFLSMAFSEDRAQLGTVKAVADGYPLRGTLIAGDAPFARGAKVGSGPKPGEIWLESRLFASIDVAIGESLEIGQALLPATKVLIKEPDRGGGFNAVGPRILMHLDDVAATGVIQPGSRVTYKLLVAGDGAALQTWSESVTRSLPDGIRLFGVRGGAEQIGRALERAERFLLLGSLLAVVLAGIAIALSAHRFAERHFDHIALLKTVGATPGKIDQLFLGMFVILGVSTTLFGSLLGVTVQWGVAEVLAPFIPVALPAPGLSPLLLGGATGAICLLAFALPPILALRDVSPSRVIRREIDEAAPARRWSYVSGVVGTLALMVWYSGDVMLTLLILSGVVVIGALLAGVSLALLKSGQPVGMLAGSALRLAMAGIRRRQKENLVQVMTFGLAIMLLLLIFLVRTSLLLEWQQQIPEDAPNHYALNITPQELPGLAGQLTDAGIKISPAYPMIRGRVTLINGESPKVRREDARGEDRAPGARSTRNLTETDTLPDDNVIIDGQWWSEASMGAPELSVESEYAEQNGLLVGDKVTFDIEGRSLEVTVTSIREVAWDNLQPNFYLILSPGSLEAFPSTVLTSFYLERGQKALLNDLLREYPTVTIIEVDAIIEQVQLIIGQVTLAIEFVLALILLAGAMVLIASLQASMDERMRQFVILRTLGAANGLILKSLAFEFLVLGAMAGLVAALGAEVSVYYLETQVFELSYSGSPFLWLLGPMMGAVLISGVGLWFTRDLVRVSPAMILRQLA